MNRWMKYGLVYVPQGKSAWARTHAYIPTAFLLDSERIRVYVSFLDDNKVGRIGYVDVAVDNPLKVLHVSPSPILDIGIPGTFDDAGVTPSCVLRHNGKIFLYYFGWQLHQKIRYTLFAGVSVSKDFGVTFTRLKSVPILERSTGELFIRSAPYILHTGGIFKCWYIAGSEWIYVDGKYVPTYNMRYLESIDGVSWGMLGKVVLNLESEDEFGFGRPCVLFENGIYKMWYSIRYKSHGYRLGYAESFDGIIWTRKDSEVGIDVAVQGWDSEMICFSSVITTKYGKYMFYNGNNYGESGFGVAVLE